MKKIIFFLMAFMLFSPFVNAQSTPQGMKYQAVARNLQGEILSNQKIIIKIKLQSSLKSNKVHYSEIHNLETNQFGLFSLVIGEGLIENGSFDNIPWSNEEIWMAIEIKDIKKGDFSTISNSKLLAVPYAFHATTASKIANGNNNNGNGQGNSFGVPSQNWSKFGNSNTDPEKDKLGTTDEADLVLVTNNIERLRITSDGKLITGDGKFTIGGNLEVQGDSTTINKDLYVGRNVHLNFSNELEPKGQTLNHGNFTTEGYGQFNKNVNVADTLFTKVLDTKGLNISSNVSDTNGGGYVATFENTNNGNGDGIKIRLGKKGIKNNSILKEVDTKLLKKWVGEIELSELNSIKKLLDGEISSEDASYLFKKAVPTDPKEIEQMTLATLASMCIIGQGVTELLAVEILNPIIEYLPLAPYIEVPVDFGCQGIGKPFSFPTLNLNDFNNPLTNENVFIEFTDINDEHVGAIKAQSLTDWVQDYFDIPFLYELTNSMRGLDKTKLISEIQVRSSKIGKGYYEIGVEYSSGNGDYAEWLERLNVNEEIGTGDIVAVKGGKITKDLTDAEQVMAVSHRPIVLGNIPSNGKVHLGNNVAFMGQIPVKIMGPVASGDYIVGKGDIKGFGVAINPKDMTLEDFKNAVGRSWDVNPEYGPKMVNTVVGVHNGDYLNIIKRFELKLKESESRLETVESKIDKLLETIKTDKSL